MRLSLTPVQAETTEAPRTYEFACERNRSATPYEVPPGRYHMQLLALDPQGEVAAGVITPPPQTRNVVWGQPSSLDAQLVVAPCAERCANKNGNCSAK